ncbi:MAG: helix-turn-helix domain-containing protein [Pyrinomonadaceae bacterium]
MSSTLGEKLRLAREEKGFTISEVAEQTRISSIYLQSIENDDYKILPGGIFNKGFVKTFAKLVGLNEQEAIAEYTQLISDGEGSEEDGPRTYRPEVLTDDRSSSSMVPTIILAVVILAIFSAGILFLVRYLREPAELASNSNSGRPAMEMPGVESPSPVEPQAPDMSTITVEFRAVSADVSLLATADGKSVGRNVVRGTAAEFSAKDTLKFSYSKSLAKAVEMTINGRAISLPISPTAGRRNAIEFEINRNNLARIWSEGSIITEIPPAAVSSSGPTATGEVTPSAAATPVRTSSTPTVRPTTAPKPTPRSTPAAAPRQTPRPAATPPPAATNRP